MAKRGQLRDRVVVVTGAANGIGLDTARGCVARGARVVMLDLDGDRVEKEAESIGAGAVPFACDVTARDDLDAAVAATLDRFGRIDVVIPNAGIGRPGALTAMAEQDYRQVVAVNLDGAWNTVRATVPHLVATRGYLLMVASAYAFMNGVGMGAHPVTKAAVEAMGRSLRVELADRGVDVGIAYFGFVDTDLVRDAFAQPSTRALAGAFPNFITRAVPVERASNAIVAGIERRAARVTAPAWIRPALALRSALALGDGMLGRDRNVRRAVDLLRDDALAPAR
jgi:NAD(P)-dependent dehydrogenase (short-subunit alcohol dehydrogenase family)